jgi:hypothetical protein
MTPLLEAPKAFTLSRVLHPASAGQFRGTLCHLWKGTPKQLGLFATCSFSKLSPPRGCPAG